MDQNPRARPARRYPVLDDAQGFATAVLLVGLGLAMLRSAHLLTGGIPGLAFVLNYASGWPLGWTLLIVNLPFIAFGRHAFGLRFRRCSCSAATAGARGPCKWRAMPRIMRSSIAWCWR